MLHIFYTVIISCFGVLNQTFLVLSLKYEDAFKISMIKTVDLFFIFILQYFLLNIETNMNNLIGVLLIALSTFIVFGFKYFNDLYTAEKNVQINQTGKNKTNLFKRIIFIKF